jgi:hypothetical protein
MDVDQKIVEIEEKIRSGSLAEAEGECISILAVFPRHFHALRLLGQILARTGRETEAIAAYEAASRVRPGDARLFTFLAMKKFREAFGTPVPPRNADLREGRRVQMRSLGRDGRFGNQLLQYAFVRLYARQHGLVAEFPDWIGRDIFDLDDPLPSASLPTVSERSVDLFGSLHGRTGEVLADRDIGGYFAGHTKEWAPFKNEFRALYEPGRNVRELLDRALDKLRSLGKTVVALHFRQADFGRGQFWIAPSSWYLTWLRSVWPNLEQPVLYIASDAHGACPGFDEFIPSSAEQLGVTIPGAGFLVDHHVLRHADYVAIANSTFSLTAAMLNKTALQFMRPDPDRRALTPFEPWSCQAPLHPSVNPEAVPTAERSLILNHLRPTDTVVYWGSYCSAWTNFARSVQQKLLVLEGEGAFAIIEALGRRDVHHVRLLVLENGQSLREFFEAASGVLKQIAVNMVLVKQCGERDLAGLSAEFSALGFVVFRLSEDSLSQITPYEKNADEAYLAITRKMVTVFQSRASRYFFYARYLCQKMFSRIGVKAS